MTDESDNSKVKLRFRLTEEQAAGGPIESESIWCRRKGRFYRIRNAPFFIEDLSFDDVIEVHQIDDEFFEIVRVVERAPNSTIWIHGKSEESAKSVTKKVHALGCGIEGGVIAGYYAINVPASVDLEAVLSLLDEAKASGRLDFFVASLRHPATKEVGGKM